MRSPRMAAWPRREKAKFSCRMRYVLSRLVESMEKRSGPGPCVAAVMARSWRRDGTALPSYDATTAKKDIRGATDQKRGLPEDRGEETSDALEEAAMLGLGLQFRRRRLNHRIDMHLRRGRVFYGQLPGGFHWRGRRRSCRAIFPAEDK